jgi:hypothetical protein
MTGPIVEDAGYRRKSSWTPTKKWFAALITGLLPIVANFVDSDFVWDDTEWAMLASLAVALIGGYIKSNDPTPGGVPTTTT